MAKKPQYTRIGKREFEIFLLRMAGIPVSELSTRYQISTERVKQIRHRAKYRINNFGYSKGMTPEQTLALEPFQEWLFELNTSQYCRPDLAHLPKETAISEYWRWFQSIARLSLSSIIPKNYT